VASYELLIKPSARRELDGIRDRDDREALVVAIAALAKNPSPLDARRSPARITCFGFGSACSE